MCATPSPASACPMWSRSSALTARRDARRLACREAYPVAERFLKALRVAGGLPSRPRTRHSIRASPSGRRRASPDFTYRPSGDIVANSGAPQAGRPRRPDRLFANPLSAGESAGLRPFAILRQAQIRRAHRAEYPWQDNFCEARSFEVGQCASRFRPPGAGYPRPRRVRRTAMAAWICDPRQQAVVAVRDGVVIRSPKQQAATLQINTRTEHIRFRYMHMNPSRDGCRRHPQRAPRRRGREDRRGLELSRPSQRHHAAICISTCRCSRATAGSGSIPTPPLISAYERLIRGRGREIGPEPPAAAAVAHAAPEDVIAVSTPAKAAAAARRAVLLDERRSCAPRPPRTRRSIPASSVLLAFAETRWVRAWRLEEGLADLECLERAAAELRSGFRPW